jgi:endonuclease YncB( thermonuclease family)
VIHRLILAALAATVFHSCAAQNAAAPAQAPADAAPIAGVIDGDTVILKGSRDRVRLADVDAPEMGHGHGRPSQPFAARATGWLRQKVQGRRVTLHCPDQDKYGRRVCVVFLDGENVNQALVRAGLAWANTAQPRYLRDKTLLDAQRDAQAARAGLWAQARPTPPWEWRWKCWEKAVCGG